MLNIQNPIEARKIIRKNEYIDQTAGTANKYVQGNLCILPIGNIQRLPCTYLLAVPAV